ncbi:MAG TPA: hypothetical protein VHS59_00280 [Bacillota bacterium]|nr:hypothetical protein [Bacillota bacterium]
MDNSAVRKQGRCLLVKEYPGDQLPQAVILPALAAFINTRAGHRVVSLRQNQDPMRPGAPESGKGDSR